ncbi:hypothetical protein KR059_010395, partial [Drosophila kikkawai]
QFAKMEEMKEALTKFETTLTLLLGQVAEVKDDIKKVNNNVVRLEEVRERVIEDTPRPQPLIAARTEYELKKISRLPDCVKELQVFEGEAGTYDSWMGRAETILKDYEIIKERPLYRSIVVSIRQKIRGNAETTLMSYNVTDDDWSEIKRVLALHYADKRDLRTLEYQMGIKIPLLAMPSLNVHSLIDSQHPAEARECLESLISEFSIIFKPLSPCEAVDTSVRAEIRTNTQEPSQYERGGGETG